MFSEGIYMSRIMGKPTICIGENRDADQLRGNRLNPKFQASSSFLCLYRPVCVRPVRKPHCWFSHKTAHMIVALIIGLMLVKPSLLRTMWKRDIQVNLIIKLYLGSTETDHVIISQTVL